MLDPDFPSKGVLWLISNLWLTQLQALGIERERYADSTGTLSEILA